MSLWEKLPIVVGVIGDFVGETESRLSLREREFVTIDKAGFDAVMRSFDVRLRLDVPNWLGGEEPLAVALRFTALGDFSFEGIARQIEPVVHLRNVKKNLLSCDTPAGHSQMPLDGLLADLDEVQELLVGGAPADADEFVDDLINRVDPGLEYTRRHRVGFVQRVVVSIDAAISKQVEEIMASDAVRELEAAWRGLHRLVSRSQGIQVRVLDATKKDLYKDIKKTPRDGQSSLHRAVYVDGLDILGNTPFTLLVANFEVDSSVRDMELLAGIARVGLAGRVPVLLGTAPAMFGLDDMADLHQVRNISRVLDPARPECARWFALRRDPDAAFVTLCMPRVLVKIDSLPSGTTRSLWGNPVFEVAAWICERITNGEWCEFDREPEANELGDIAYKRIRDADGTPRRIGPTEVLIEDSDNAMDIGNYVQGWELSAHGFLPLVLDPANPGKPQIPALTTLYRPDSLRETSPRVIARQKLLGMLSYSLAISRICNAVRVAFRDGSGRREEEICGELEGALGTTVGGADGSAGKIRINSIAIGEPDQTLDARISVQIEFGADTLDPGHVMALEISVPRPI